MPLPGSTSEETGDTTTMAGSLLDDNQWHDVEIRRNERFYFSSLNIISK